MGFWQKMKSRKFLMALIAAIIGVLKAEIWPEMPDQVLLGIFGVIISYILGEAIVDREREKSV